MEPAEKVKILIVDDKPANLLALEAILETQPYELVRAASGEEAVERVERERFAAILLDVQMPGIDGYEAARRIKKLPNGRDVPIVFVTAVYREDEDARRGYAAGGLDFFPKPLDPELLRTKIKLYADLYVMSRAVRDENGVAELLREHRITQRKLETILRTISEGVVVVDRRGDVVHINGEALRIFGSEANLPFKRRHEYVGTHPETGDVISSSDWPLVRALEHGEASASELTEIARPDGSKLVLINSAAPVRTEDGEVVGAVCVFKELSQAASKATMGRASRARPRPEPRRRRQGRPSGHGLQEGLHLPPRRGGDRLQSNQEGLVGD